MADFAELPLHDAILRSVRMSWRDRECLLELQVFFERESPARPGTLIFTGVTKASLPHGAPWGESAYVNSCILEAPGHFAIEMQSGDRLTFSASGSMLRERTAA